MRTQTLFVDVNHPRRKTPLQEFREAIENRTNMEGPTTRTIGGGSPDYCAVSLPPTPPIQVDVDALLDELGLEVGEIDNDRVVLFNSLDTKPVLLAKTTRSTSTQYVLPSAASYVSDVWFDSLHADPFLMWDFSPNRVITTATALPSDVEVQVLYVGIAVE